MRRHPCDHLLLHLLPALLLVLGLVLAGSGVARADAPLEDRKAGVADELRRNPEDPQLWLFQADLHREEGRSDEAIAAYQNAARFGADIDGVDTTIAVILAEAGMPAASAATLDRVLTRNPDYRGARIERARQRAARGEATQAADDFEHALAGAGPVRPGLVLEGMEILVLAGRRADALALADGQMEGRGPLVALQMPAIEIALSLGSTEDALTRIDSLIRTAPTHPGWLQRRGEILAAAGQEEQASESFRAALAAVEERKANRNNRRLAMLEEELRTQLARETATQGETRK